MWGWSNTLANGGCALILNPQVVICDAPVLRQVGAQPQVACALA